MTTTLDVTVASRSDVGRVRTNNEDHLYVSTADQVYVVCDGMGGHNAGEVASQMACEIIGEALADASKLKEKYLASGKARDAKALRKAMDAAISKAGKDIYKQAGKNSGQAGMGTTCTAVMLIGHGKGILGHVGDSRFYVARAGKIHQLSEDHTYVNELVRRGAITADQAESHPQANVLSRALGVQPGVTVDTMIFDIDPGDTYLLCSDGLHNYFPNEVELLDGLHAEDLEAGLNASINMALDRGGHDNTTAIAFRIGGQAPSDGAATAAEQRIQVLKRIPIFQHLSYNELVHVLGLTQLQAAPAGTVLISEGDEGDTFYVLLQGEATITKGSDTLATIKAGAHIGEMAMVDNARRSATVTINQGQDATVLVMRREEFFGLIRSEPTVATKLLWSFVNVLSGRLRETSDALHGARNELTERSQSLDLFQEKNS